MIGLDTNVVVRFAVQDDPKQSKAARAVFARLTAEEPGFISLLVLVELFWVLRRSYGLATEAIHEFLEHLMDAPELEVEDEESVTRALALAREGAEFADALIGETARLYGCSEVVTFDRRAARTLGWRQLG
jgi:predicted nucleic-acid-binding protein